MQIEAQPGSPLITLAVAAHVTRAVTAQGEVQAAVQRVILGIIVLGVVAIALFLYLRSLRTRESAARSAFARTFCFFCAQPLEFDQRFSVGLPLGGQSREVSACREHAEQLTTGGQPAVTAVNHGGRQIPWFAAPDYDPSLDYRSRQSETLPLSTVLAEFHTAAVAQSSPPSALSDPRASDDWWKVGATDSASADAAATHPAPASADPNDQPANRASQAP
jgi:hypothetical protein